MTWISLVCLLALSSSAFSGPAYGGYSSVSLPQMPSFVPTMRDQTIQRPFLPSLQVATPVKLPIQSGYGQQQQGMDWTPSMIPRQQDQVQQQFIPQQNVQTTYGSSFGAQELPKVLDQSITQGYGKMNQGYGSVSRLPQFDQQVQIQPQVLPLTQADILCRGQIAETVIPIEDGRKFVVCLAESKGVEQHCPKGLWYHQESRRCEKKLGPLENQCVSQPCLNGGQCTPTEFSYQCQCAPGFDGKTCELDARVCQTQQPCGQSPDARCQSFRWGAALDHICILQDGLAYGLTAQQAQQSPCQGIDGPQALAVSNKGFIMCDGERMFIESCPGGTIWDDLNKACVWPDMQGVIASPQFDQQQPSYDQQSYGQTPIIAHHHHRSMINRPKHHIQRQQDQSKLVQQYGQAPTQSYGAETIQRPQFDLSLLQPQIQLQVPQQQSGYGAQQDLTQQSLVQRPQFDSSLLLQQPQQQLSYGAQTTVQRPQFDLTLLQQQPQSSYGAQTTVQRPTFDSSILQQQRPINWQEQKPINWQEQKPINWQQPQQDVVQVKQLSSGY